MGFEFLILLGLGLGVAFAVSGDDDNDSTDTSSDDDQLIRARSGEDIQTGAGDDVIVSSSPLDAAIDVQSGDGNDLIDLIFAEDTTNAETAPTINSGAGDDVVRVLADALRLETGAGNDTIESDNGNPTSFGLGVAIDAGEGDDQITMRTDGYDTRVSGGDGNDTFTIPHLEFGTYEGGDGDDTFITSFDNSLRDSDAGRLFGGAGDDLFQVTSILDTNEGSTDYPSDQDDYIINGGEGADRIELTLALDRAGVSSDDSPYEGYNPARIRGFDPDEDTLVIMQDALLGSMELNVSITETNFNEGTSLHDNLIRFTYTSSDSGIEVTTQMHVSATRALTVEDVQVVAGDSGVATNA